MPQRILPNRVRTRIPVILQLAGAFVVLFANPASANGGTPLIWTAFSHMFYGNALIGILEGTILQRMFKRGIIKSILFSVVANYVSCFVGWVLILKVQNSLYDGSPIWITLNNAWYFILASFAGVYFFTVVLEAPFVFLLIKPVQSAWKKSFRASFILQLVSYLVLALIYAHYSDVSLLTQVKQRPLKQVVGTSDAWIYYVAENHHDVYRIHLTKLKKEKVYSGNHHVYIRFKKEQKLDEWNFIASEWIDSKQESKEKILIHNIPMPDDKKRNDNIALSLNTDSTLVEDEWTLYGISIHPKGRKSYHVALHTPFLTWDIRQHEVFSNEHVLFSTSNQIFILDAQRKWIALLARGSDPVVIPASIVMD